MTIKKSQLRQFGQAVKATQLQKKKGYFAVLGTLTGEVLTGVSNLVYITTFEGQTLTVINRRVPNRPGSVVFVGSDDYSANRIEILYTLNVEGATNDGSSAGSTTDIVPPHDHSSSSLNPTWIYDSQFTPLLVLPISGTLTVQVYPGAIRKTGSTGWKYIGDQVVDLSGDMPASGACWALLQANDDGTVDAVIGSGAAARADLIEADIPEATTGKGIVAIVLEAGYTELYRNNTRNDFLDLRFDKAGGGGGSDAAAVTYTPGDLNDWDYLSDPGSAADALDQLADRAAALEFGGGGGLTQGFTSISPTTSDITATVSEDINYHAADVSGLTADRNFILPAGTAGKRIVLSITTGDDTYEFIVKGDTGITIEGGSAATEWSRLFISGESVELLATNSTNWQVVHDGRLPCLGRMSLSGADTTNTAGVDTTPTWDVADLNRGDICDLVNYRFNVRRAGYYRIAGGLAANTNIADTKYIIAKVYQGVTLVAQQLLRNSTAAAGPQPCIPPKVVLCAVGDTLLFQYATQDANMGIINHAASFFQVEET